ncbi:MAG TPA: hypothetical protein PLW35_09235, partial [Verrucomicrobiota bacterium]|nr:hypothetical protein [Verrucomicrobiota bacterium]
MKKHKHIGNNNALGADSHTSVKMGLFIRLHSQIQSPLHCSNGTLTNSPIPSLDQASDIEPANIVSVTLFAPHAPPPPNG